MIKVVDVSVVRPYILEVTFSDGVTKTVNVEPTLWGPVFKPLKENAALFNEAYVDPIMRTVAWPNGADLAPEYLYNAEMKDQHA